MDLSFREPGRLSPSTTEAALDKLIHGYVSFGRRYAAKQSVALKAVPNLVGKHVYKSGFNRTKCSYADFLKSRQRRQILGDGQDWLAVLFFFLGRLKSASAVSDEGLAAMLEESLMSQIEDEVQSFLLCIRGARIQLGLIGSR